MPMPSAGGFHRNMLASASVGELGQGTHDDLSHRPCGVAQSLVHAGAGGVAPYPILQAFGIRMKANGLAPKAVVGAAMRKLAHLIYGVVKSRKPFDANFAMNRVVIQDGI